MGTGCFKTLGQAACRCVVGLALLSMGPALADPIDDAHRVSANPDTPTTGMEWRDYLHGSVGVDVPILAGADRGGWVLHVPVMIELSNDTDEPMPNDYWRGLLGVELAYRLPTRYGGFASLGLEVHHESDHETRRDIPPAPYGFYQLNTVSLHPEWSVGIRGQRVTFSAYLRLHVSTCTNYVNVCPDVDASDIRASQTFEGVGEIVWDGPMEAPVPGKPRPVVAFYANEIIPRGDVVEEHRFVANAGVWLPTRHGHWEVFGLGWLGNDVGYLRHDRVKELGVGFRWTSP